MIFSRPWLATDDAYIGCQEGGMTIAKEDAVKNLVLYPHIKPILPIVKINKQEPAYLEERIRSPLKLAEELEFNNQTEDDVINNFINQPANMKNVKCQTLK